jgi:putative ABC transport system permease protein
VQSLPGVTSVGLSSWLPLSGDFGTGSVLVEGLNTPFSERPVADIHTVNSEYFRTLNIPLRSGRVFDVTDRTQTVAVLSTTAAERLWPGQNPVGKRFRRGSDSSPLIEVVGIVGNTRNVSLDKSPALTIYLPYWQLLYSSSVSWLVRTASDPLATSSAIREAIHRIDPELPLAEFRTMEEVVAQSVAQRRFQMSLVLLFAAAAMLLANLGIYGVISYAVTQRTHEMGIRMALGAAPAQIRRLVLRQGLSPVAAGLGAGSLASLAVGRLLGGLLFGIGATDPMTICSVVVLLSGVAAVATYLPAHRATRIDPLVALRYE